MASAAPPPTTPDRAKGTSPSQNREFFNIAQGPYPTGRGGGAGARRVDDRSGNRVAAGAAAAARPTDLADPSPNLEGEWPVPGVGPSFKGRPGGQGGAIPPEGAPPPDGRDPDPPHKGARPRHPVSSLSHGAGGLVPPEEGGPRQGGGRGDGPRGRPGARLPPDPNPPSGPAFIIIKRDDEETMGGFSPFKLKRWLERLCGEPVATAKVIRSGALLVQTRSQAQNSKLMGATNIDGTRVSAEVAVWLNSSEGVIYSPDLRCCSDEELLEELAPQGVIEVCRLRTNRGSPNPLIRLRFKGLDLPPRVMCGYLAVLVKAWIPPPRQCRKCWRFGHTDRTCRSRSPICGRCADRHPTDDCAAEVAQCASCQGRHPAWDRGCPRWAEAKERNRARQNAGPAPAPPAPPAAPQPRHRPGQVPPPATSATSHAAPSEWPFLPDIPGSPRTPRTPRPRAAPSPGRMSGPSILPSTSTSTSTYSRQRIAADDTPTPTHFITPHGPPRAESEHESDNDSSDTSLIKSFLSTIDAPSPQAGYGSTDSTESHRVTRSRALNGKH